MTDTTPPTEGARLSAERELGIRAWAAGPGQDRRALIETLAELDALRADLAALTDQGGAGGER